MKVTVKMALLSAILAVAITLVQAETSESAHYSKPEIKKMERDAHTVQQYRALAAYFSAQKTEFEMQAQAEKEEWERRSQNVAGPAAKYPRPVDSSRNRFEYFSYEADQMNQQEAKYQALAEKSKQ
jgi:hypothetical protein